MIRLRTGTVTAVKDARPGVLELVVEIDGRPGAALAYPSLTGAVAEGDRVVLNTTAVALGLGTGGFHIVVAVEGGSATETSSEGHVMKLRYTPVQAAVLTAEEQGSAHHGALRDADSLDGTPVVWVPLHSMVGAAVAGARVAGAERVAHVMTDGAALPLWLSEQVAALGDAGLLAGSVTSGQAVGGDVEAVTVFSALLAARHVLDADAIVVADGPGKVGTETRWGATDVASGMALNAAGILGGRPIASLRLNFADPDYRHHGVSPHSLTVLERVALVPTHVAVPTLEDAQRDVVWEALRGAKLEERHQLVEVAGAPALEALAEHGIPMRSMGRDAAEEPSLFLAAGAAGVLAGRMAAASARWKR